jgi:hypothetical protein
MSSTNSETAAQVERLLHEVRTRIEQTSKEVRDATATVMALRLRRTELFKDLAELRLDVLAGERVGEDLDLVERQAAAILRERDEMLTVLEREVAEATACEESLAAERVVAVERIEGLRAEIDALAVRVAEELALDPAYQAQAEQAREAEAKASRAERKVEQAAKDRVEKGKPYEANPFFMYLWQRKYGTKDYWDWPAFRYLDGKVARLCDYDAARAGYEALLGLPERLSEHAACLRAQVDEETQARLETLKREALAAAGHGVLSDTLAGEVAEAKQFGEKLAAAAEVLRGLRQRQATYLGGADKGYKEAVSLLATGLDKNDLKTLYEEARATPMPEDDEVVAELERLLAELDDREAGLAAGRSVLRAQSQYLKELESLADAWRQRSPEESKSSVGGFLAAGGVTIAALVALGVPLGGVAIAIEVAAAATASSWDEGDES